MKEFKIKLLSICLNSYRSESGGSLKKGGNFFNELLPLCKKMSL